MTPFFPSLRPLLAPMGARSVSKPLHKIKQATLAQLEASLAGYFQVQSLHKRPEKDHSRERVLPLNRTFWCWLWQMLQGNTSCREVVRQLQMLFALGGLAIDEGTSAYCQSRKKIKLSLLTDLVAEIGRSAWRLTPQGILLGGRRLKAWDGSSARLPDTKANRKDFPPPSSQKPGTGFPVMKFVALFCIGSGVILGHSVGDLHTQEITLAAQLLSLLSPGDVVVLDRAFCFFAMTARLQALGVDSIIRVPTTVRRIDFRKGEKLGRNDALFEWKKPKYKKAKWLSAAQWDALPERLSIRILRVPIKLPGVRVSTVTLATTLLDPVRYSAHEIAEAFRRRWREEMCFDDLKTTLGMGQLKGQSPEMARKEMSMFLIAHNLVRCLMLEGARQAEVSVQQISFKGALDGFRQCSNALAQAKSKAIRQQLWHEFIRTLSADRVPDRPGRIEPRAVKRIIKYPKLTRHRRRFKDRLSRNERRRNARQRCKNVI